LEVRGGTPVDAALGAGAGRGGAVTLVEGDPAAEVLDEDELPEGMTEGEAYLWAILSDQSGADLVEFLWTDAMSGDGLYRLFPYQWLWWRRQATRAVDQCVASGQRVRTSRGEIPIERVVLGDEVLTARGRFRAVTAVRDNGEQDVVHVTSGTRSLLITDEHPLLVQCNGVEEWLQPSRFGSDFIQWCELNGDGKLIWRPIEVSLTGTAHVYDLEVDEDASYVVEGVVVHNCGRDVGKTERLNAKACAFPFNFPANEHVITAPEAKHIDKLTIRLEHHIRSTWLLDQMVLGGAKNGIIHRPFRIAWANGASTQTIVPGRAGTGLKGTHAVTIDVDEAQDLPERAWREMPATLRKDIPGHSMTAHGVSKGVRDHFYEITQPGSGYLVHRITAMHKPSYKMEDRVQLIKEYGNSEDSPDFRRNVWGEHGDSANRVFLLAFLLACTDTREEGSDVNDEYLQMDITGDELAARAGSKVAVEVSSDEAVAALTGMVQLPPYHQRFATTWMGMDVGLVGDPTEIVVLAEYEPDKRERNIHKANEIAVPEEGVTRFRLIARFRVQRLPEPLQADLVMHLINFYKPKTFALDAGGNGLPVFQELQKRAGKSRVLAIEPPAVDTDNPTVEQLSALAEFERKRKDAAGVLTVIKGYKFGSKLLAEFNEEEVAKLVEPDMKTMIEKAGVFMEAKTLATHRLRSLVDNRRLLLPNDDEVINQMNGQTFSWSAEPVDANGNRRAVYCVDDETMALERDRGWVGVNDIQVGDNVFALNTESMCSEWTPVLAVNRFPGPHRMVFMENNEISAFTTDNHRWFVIRHYPHWDTWIKEWRTAEELVSLTRIPRQAFCNSLPLIPKYDDDFVELAAWFFTEGSWRWNYRPDPTTSKRVKTVGDYNGCALGQSWRVNRDNCARIRHLLTRVLGREGFLRGGNRWVEDRWRPSDDYITWRLDKRIADDLWAVMDDPVNKVIARDFILALTAEQLNLFIDVANLADAHMPEVGGAKFAQSHIGRARAYEFAAILAGYPVSFYPTMQNGVQSWMCSELSTDNSSIWKGKHGRGQHTFQVVEDYTGEVWCPTTRLGTFLARRHGTTYYTGNSVGVFHILDAMRFFVLGWSQEQMERLTAAAEKPQEPVIPRFGLG
jgi:hypothetical protein